MPALKQYIEQCGGVMFVAELGLNHNGSGDLAVRMAESAIDAGADAVKVQVFDPDEFAAESATYNGESQREMFRRYMLSRADLERVRDAVVARGKVFFGTPTDLRAADLLDELGAPWYKVGSDDLTNLGLIGNLSERGKDMILSSGMSTGEEIYDAVSLATLRTENKGRTGVAIAMLHCVSLYPCPPKLANLARIRNLADDAWIDPVGYSDHTDYIQTAALAVACGAKIIEKHFTLDRAMEGPDHAFSADWSRFASMVQYARHAQLCLGDGRIDPQEAELEMAKQARRLVVASREVPKGHRITEADIAYRRASWKPGALFQRDNWRVLEHEAARDIAMGEVVTPGDVEGGEE